MKNFNLDAILEAMLKMSERVSDLNFSVGRQPQVEIDGQLVPVNFPGLPRLTPYQTEMIAMHMLRGDKDLMRTLLQSGSVDLSYSIPQKTRFRVNIFSQRGTYAIVLRVIPEGIPTLEKLAALGRELDADTFVVGIPRRAKSDAGERKYRDFAERLRQRTCKQVVLWDETLTTVEAEERLRAAGRRGRDAKRDIDMHAAAVILQSYLDSLSGRTS